MTEDDNLELIEGYLVHKDSMTPPHDCTITLVTAALSAVLPADWLIRTQCAITLPDSEPEPDIVVARGGARTYAKRHPNPTDLGNLIEVADSTLASDRSDKGRIYARAKAPVYWTVNLIDRQIEVYEQPSGPTPVPGYAKTTICGANDTIPMVLDGVTVATFAVRDLLP